MEFFRIRKDIPFMRHALVFNAISALTFVAAVFFLATRGLHLSVEFTGGTVLEVAYEQTADLGKVRQTVETLKLGEVQVQNFGTSHDVMIRVPVRGDIKQTEVSSKVFGALCTAEQGKVVDRQYTTDKGEQVSRQACDVAGHEPVKLSRVEAVGASVGDELAQDGAMALLFVVIGIVIYLAFRFEWKFAVAAILANLHDVVIILGFFAFFQWEFSLSVLAAVLAVLGYSVNESVVIFDRIREAFRKYRKMTTVEVIDHAITSTMSRTVITHGSTQMMVLSMLLFGGPTLHYFAVALTIGILFGIYSSVFVAAAIAMWLGVKREDLLKAVASGKDGDPNDPNAGAVV
ncbi:protein translocase subunit SecF [Ideonella sp. 4Y16]|uniref:Protein-export membrane protein SecF n=1 Tax=Ideonella alba TaxID=2824118 RepID=A0A940YHT7_9BURK|nr:protein translocase subunit SecF [Ideonella alba]MBQ0932780.1 protein translocase subunit SecF [Ideonella alba]MBQ0946042.1 protein translocase subunit SecF [Ideonella alba]